MSNLGTFFRDPFNNPDPTNQPTRHARSGNNGGSMNANQYRATMPRPGTNNSATNTPSTPDPARTIVRMVIYMADGTEKVFQASQINSDNAGLTSILDYNLNRFIGRFWKHPRAANDPRYVLCDDALVEFAQSQGINVGTPEEAAEILGFQYLMLEVDKNDPTRPKVVDNHWFVYNPSATQSQPQPPVQPPVQPQRPSGTYAQPSQRPQQGNTNT